MVGLRDVQPPPAPFIVKIIEPNKDPTGLGTLRDVMIGSIGLTGVIVMLAIISGAVCASLLFWIRSRRT